LNAFELDNFSLILEKSCPVVMGLASRGTREALAKTNAAEDLVMASLAGKSSLILDKLGMIGD
jgi:hypothetical protein